MLKLSKLYSQSETERAVRNLLRSLDYFEVAGIKLTITFDNLVFEVRANGRLYTHWTGDSSVREWTTKSLNALIDQLPKRLQKWQDQVKERNVEVEEYNRLVEVLRFVASCDMTANQLRTLERWQDPGTKYPGR